MNVMHLFTAIRRRIVYYFDKLKDTVIKITIEPPIVKPIDETIDKIISDRCSVSRYGDGEVKIMLGKSIGFQSANMDLAARLKQILISNDNNFIVCLPDVFGSMERFNEAAKSYWSFYLLSTRLSWYKLINKKKTYYNAFITRLYHDLKEKSKSKDWFNKIKRVWHEREIVIVEGYKSRLGIGNNLFSNAKSIVRILAPAENAFAKYEEIMEAVRKQEKFKLILLALGPTATVLAYDLHKEGYQAIDIGHIDLEYEWFLRQTANKIKIPYKYVNEVEGGRQVEDVSDEKYLKEIISVI